MSDQNPSPGTAQLVVVGGGPGGYHAAFKAAALGLEVTIVDPEANPGGVCLHRGCIPSKALLHVAKLVSEAREAAEIGVVFAEPEIDDQFEIMVGVPVLGASLPRKAGRAEDQIGLSGVLSPGAQKKGVRGSKRGSKKRR